MEIAQQIINRQISSQERVTASVAQAVEQREGSTTQRPAPTESRDARPAGWMRNRPIQGL